MLSEVVVCVEPNTPAIAHKKRQTTTSALLKIQNTISPKD